jgi:hypothetical protein
VVKDFYRSLVIRNQSKSFPLLNSEAVSLPTGISEINNAKGIDSASIAAAAMDIWQNYSLDNEKIKT